MGKITAIRLKEIAAMAGVSTATVSRVINDDPRISAETKKRVRRCLQKAGYRMNIVARSLKTSRTQSIGLVVPELAEEFFMRIAHGIEDELRRHDYNILICNAGGTVAQERDRISLLLEKKVDGMIIIPCSGRGGHFRVLRGAGVPAVIVDRLVRGFRADAVVVDNLEGTRRAIEAIIDAGYRRIAFIGADNDISTARDRHAGYLEALRGRGMEPEGPLVRFGDFHMESGYRIMRELMTMERPPDHVFIINYYMSLGAVRYLMEEGEGTACRDTVAISNFDELSSTRLLGPVAFTVAQPVVEIGTEAARLMMRRLEEGDGAAAVTLMLKTELVRRGVGAPGRAGSA